MVLASPVNCGNATAIFRRFMERLIGCAYWPWGQAAPKARTHVRTLKAALVATSAMPGFLIPVATGTRRALRTAAKILGAKPVASLWIGLSRGGAGPQALGARAGAGAADRDEAGVKSREGHRD